MTAIKNPSTSAEGEYCNMEIKITTTTTTTFFFFIVFKIVSGVYSTWENSCYLKRRDAPVLQTRNKFCAANTAQVTHEARGPNNPKWAGCAYLAVQQHRDHCVWNEICMWNCVNSQVANSCDHIRGIKPWNSHQDKLYNLKYDSSNLQKTSKTYQVFSP